MKNVEKSSKIEKSSKKVEKSNINSRLLAVRGVIRRDYLPLADRLAEPLRPTLDFAGQDVVPLLVLLPMAEVANARAVDLAAAMQLAYLAGRVHDLNSEQGAELCGHAILVGDYLYAFAALRLHNAGFAGWLDRMGRSLVRRSEARQVRLGWHKRPYVAYEERLTNLPREHAEVLSVAAGLAADAAGLRGEEAAAYAEFGFYLGILHGIEVDGLPHNEPCDRERARALHNARAALYKLPEISLPAEELLLAPLCGGVDVAKKADKSSKNREEIG